MKCVYAEAESDANFLVFHYNTLCVLFFGFPPYFFVNRLFSLKINFGQCSRRLCSLSLREIFKKIQTRLVSLRLFSLSMNFSSFAVWQTKGLMFERVELNTGVVVWFFVSVLMDESGDFENYESNFFRLAMLNNGRKYKCSKCNKMYRYKCTLQRHITYECGKQPNFHCPYCPVSMKRKSNLLSHIAAKHSIIL